MTGSVESGQRWSASVTPVGWRGRWRAPAREAGSGDRDQNHAEPVHHPDRRTAPAKTRLHRGRPRGGWRHVLHTRARLSELPTDPGDTGESTPTTARPRYPSDVIELVETYVYRPLTYPLRAIVRTPSRILWMVDSKDHAVAASSSTTRTNSATALHH